MVLQTFKEFTNALHDAGWESTYDAQHDNVRELWKKMTEGDASKHLKDGMKRRYFYNPEECDDVILDDFIPAPHGKSGLCQIVFKGWYYIVSKEVARMLFLGTNKAHPEDER